MDARLQNICLIIFICFAFTYEANGQSAPHATIDNALQLPDLSKLVPPVTDARGMSASLQILVLLTVLTLIPSILVMTTAFPRVIIVLGILRQAIGAPQLPPGQVLLGLSLFITLVVMAPTWQRIHAEAITPYFNNQMAQTEAFDVASTHLRSFMHRQIETAGNEEDVYMFLEYSRNQPIDPAEQVQVAQLPMTVLIPAFILSELKTGFIIGFRIYLPFLVIDMVIATILLSMGMLMLPPVLISLPFKLLLFVLADGWHLVVENLLGSFA